MRMNKKIRINLVILIAVIISIYILSITRSKNITIQVDGGVIEYKGNGESVEEVIDEANITLNENDKINYNLNDEARNNQEIVINRVTIKEIEIIKEIDFNETIVKDYKTNIGETRVVSEGKKGQKKVTYIATYEDGLEVNRVLQEEEIISEPIDKIVAQGSFDVNSLTVCVNKNRSIDDNYEPNDLVLPNVRAMSSTSQLYMREEAASALEKLFKGAENEGYYLYAVSGYRSYNTQKSIYNPYSGYSAAPGTSEHQLGLAMDVSLSKYAGNLYVEFGDSKEGIWLKKNAHKYGFIIRYLEGKEDITGYKYEPWHIRYVGKELATELYEKGITLEEYYGEY